MGSGARAPGRGASRHPYLDHPWPIPFAHRGGGLEAPENTLAAFGYAVDLGFRYIETDVQTTRDGVLLVFHDDELERLTGVPGRPGEHDWAQLRHARVQEREPIPLFEEVITSWPEVRLNIDPKSDAAADALLDVLRARPDLLDRVCVGSFSGRRLARMRAALGPRLCTSAGPVEVARVAARGLRLPVPRPAALAAQVPVRQWGLPVVTRPFIAAAHRLDMPVHVWTVDRWEEMERLLDMGVDGIMTDRPGLLKSVLTSRGLWR